MHVRIGEPSEWKTLPEGSPLPAIDVPSAGASVETWPSRQRPVVRLSQSPRLSSDCGYIFRRDNDSCATALCFGVAGLDHELDFSSFRLRQPTSAFRVDRQGRVSRRDLRCKSSRSSRDADWRRNKLNYGQFKRVKIDTVERHIWSMRLATAPQTVAASSGCCATAVLAPLPVI